MSDLAVKEFVFRKGASKRIPVSGTFELTSRCNFRCKMCYIHMSKDEQEKIGKELTTQEWITLGREAVDAGMIYLLLTGGEPLLRPDFLELYTALIRMGLLITVNTNASLITPQVVECFRKHRPERVNVTLYGMSDDTYGCLCGNARGFEDALRGIRMLKQAGIMVNLNSTFTTCNLKDMEAIVNFAKEENIPIRMSGYIFPPVRNGKEEENVNLTAEEMGRACADFDWMTMNEEQRKRRKTAIQNCLNEEATADLPESKAAACLAGKGAFWISWDGKMYPCGMLSDFSQDVRPGGFADAWKKTVERTAQIYLPAECSTCKYRKLCPSCAAVTQCANKKTDVVDRNLCVRTKAYIDVFLNKEKA